MKAHVTLLRSGGRLSVPDRPTMRAVGELSLTHLRISPDEPRTVPVLQLLGASGQELYEPKLTSVFVDTLKFSGLEFVGGAWYAQEWRCELTP